MTSSERELAMMELYSKLKKDLEFAKKHNDDEFAELGIKDFFIDYEELKGGQ